MVGATAIGGWSDRSMDVMRHVGRVLYLGYADVRVRAPLPCNLALHRRVWVVAYFDFICARGGYSMMNGVECTAE